MPAPMWRAELRADGRVYYGTATEIVEEMRSRAFSPAGSTDEYMAWATAQAVTQAVVPPGPRRVAAGGSQDERCLAWLRALQRAGVVALSAYAAPPPCAPPLDDPHKKP